MNKKVLFAVFLCFSVLLAPLPIVSAASSGDWEACEIRHFSTDATLSLEQLLALLALPEYDRANEEPEAFPIPPGGDGGGTPPPPTGIVYTMIVIDDDAQSWLQGMVSSLGINVDWTFMCYWANDILEAGDAPFWNLAAIDFITSEFRYWNSPSGTLNLLLSWAQTTFPKPAGIDVTFVLTGQLEMSGANLVAGRAEVLGDAFIVSTRALDMGLCPLSNVWQHEASHLYGCSDHDWSDPASCLLLVCVMSYMWMPYTKNWCSWCSSTIIYYRYRFG